jgi:hypothetical protein
MNNLKIKKLINLKASIYYDIVIHLIFLAIFFYSLISNTYNIFPIDDLLKPFIGINNFKEFIQAMNIVLFSFSLIFITQSIILLKAIDEKKIEKVLVATILYYKWLITTLASVVPFIYNHPINPIYLVFNICLLYLFWYQKTEYST